MPGRSHVVKYCALIGANDATLTSCSDLFSLEVMAAVGVLERREKRTFMDDTIPLSATITTYKLLPSHVVSSCSHISHKVIDRHNHLQPLHLMYFNHTLQTAGVYCSCPARTKPR